MIKILELFGGIGAPRKALVNLGIDHKAIDYVEWQANRVKAYNALYDHLHKPQDVKGWNLKPDILIHGSPCQDNSRANKKRKGTAKDSRSQLLLETLRIIKEMGEWRPKVVIWENVKGVLDRNVVPVFNYYLQEMKMLGYTNAFDVLDARNFGIPHARERVFCISLLGNETFDFSKLRYKPMKNIKEFLEYEPDDEIPSQYLINIPSMLSKIKEFNPRASGSYKRQLDVINDYCYTITERQDRCPNAGIIRLNKPQYRYLTERECWRLLGFDDEDYELMLKEFPSKKGKRNATLYALAGNSIVVDVLEAIFEVLLTGNHGQIEIKTNKSGQLELVC
ncbi:DNA cytosine methyltransferase [Brevibacillus laterosporus]|uniref:DNA (cytosine-5-)-methyltransferase n=1 Tax=Brevibacillus laterosporus TaxID=1465 RepID=A0AAP3GCI8_BRELA|nr:DNA (cytosine-5-)-methyltransferase [Brevibacillus laterosporus]MCR8982636.1 DNA (cytosine-5-)-methyltransferase [Brevibacillus laterosporus]MCZ0809792.1 DNA (cytosine-5-)-methyltransferase [Brevibacillus laterosporus]MCZ0828374.1 DNA (cytosine-5-)-methyltransferase [Brevibacillus laterosporus]MCZ0852384.1 DNA (cytosine-5-)-methyltransferase [Brevibacillus laterosporus]